MKIIKIFNRITGDPVCTYYWWKEVDLTRSKFEIGKPLDIVFTSGSGFNHEKIEFITKSFNGMKSVTTNKFWILKDKT